MEWKKIIAVFLIGFVGMCCVISVDRECAARTGKGGNIGLSLSRTAEGNLSVCFFGIEGEIGL